MIDIIISNLIELFTKLRSTSILIMILIFLVNVMLNYFLYQDSFIVGLTYTFSGLFIVPILIGLQLDLLCDSIEDM